MSDFPRHQVRNGFAEIIKISSVGALDIWRDLVKYGPELVKTRFGRANNDTELIKIADSICERAIRVMLDLESPNLHEIKLDRVSACVQISSIPTYCDHQVIAFGHTYAQIKHMLFFHLTFPSFSQLVANP